MDFRDLFRNLGGGGFYDGEDGMDFNDLRLPDYQRPISLPRTRVVGGVRLLCDTESQNQLDNFLHSPVNIAEDLHVSIEIAAKVFPTSLASQLLLSKYLLSVKNAELALEEIMACLILELFISHCSDHSPEVTQVLAKWCLFDELNVSELRLMKALPGYKD